MKKLLLFALVAMFAVSAMADVGWYSDYVIASVDGGADQYFWIGDDPSWGTEFDGYDFGVVGTLEIGADMRYWSDTQDRDGGAMYWVTDGGTTPNEVIWTQTYLGGNDYQGIATVDNDVADGLGDGAHTVSVWAKSWGTGQGDSWLDNSGSFYTADFEVSSIPEPATMSLLGLGALAMVLRRKIRK